MDKKRLLIFGGLSILAIVCAFGIVNIFSPKYDTNKKIDDKKNEISQDFIDVDTYNVDDYKEEENEEVVKNDITEEVIDKKESDVPVSTQTFEKLETDSWNDYLKEAEEYGYDFSDIGNTIFVEFEDTLKDESKVSDGELSFLNNLMILADNYTAAYEEMISYIYSSNMDDLKIYYEGDYNKTIEEFKTLDTLGIDEFEKIKEDYLNGMIAQQEGFKVYMKEPESTNYNDLFIQSDHYFYDGQQKLTQLLDSYK